MEYKGEILVLPFFGQGHLFPCMELCKRFSTYHNCKSILIVPSNISSSVPSPLRRHALLEVVDIPNPPPSDSPDPLPSPKSFKDNHKELGCGIESFLAKRYVGPGMNRPVCAVVDLMMGWSNEIFEKFNIPVATFFTSGACASTMQYAGWVHQVGDMKPGETRVVDGLPDNMAIKHSDLKMFDRHIPDKSGPPAQDGPDKPASGRRPGPPGPGSKPRWFDETKGSIAWFFNTCDALERPFLNYLGKNIDKPVYGIGPLLPESYWKSIDSALRDTEVRSNRESNYRQDQVMQWLDTKPYQSVIYVSFGSEVGPTMEEHSELCNALEELNRPFIWVLQPNSGIHGFPVGFFHEESGSEPKVEGYYPVGLDKKVGDRGLIIKGWAPQLLILSHPSIGGFLSHCGWNSTVEAIGKGVPFLTWPIRGDQFDNANLVVNHLKVGHHLLHNDDDPLEMVKKDHIMKGIHSLMDDKEAHMHALALRSKFNGGFPASSEASLKSFVDAFTLHKD